MKEDYFIFSKQVFAINFLDNSILILALTFAEDENSENIYNIVEDGLTFLEMREQFWKQQTKSKRRKSAK